MSAILAGPANPTPNAEYTPELHVQPPKNLVKETAARLYGQGYKRTDIARMLLNHLTPNTKLTKPSQRERRYLTAKFKLSRWEKEQAFRDMIWEMAVAKLDLQTPLILEGVATKAKRGNVMAARLALEVTGRHNPKGDAVPTQIAIVVNGMPRPGSDAISQHDDVEVAQVVMADPDDEV